MTESIAWVLAAACLGTGLVCLALAAGRVGDRDAQLTHAAMGVAMAGMFSPWGDPVPGWVGAAGFSVVGAWFAALALRRGRPSRTAHHLAISSAAMVLMYLAHHHPGPATGGAAAGAHAGHLAGGGGAASLLVLPLALVLAGYFAWHSWTCVERSRTPVGIGPTTDPTAGPATVTATVATRAPARVEPVAHGVMSALMAAMFLVMV